MSYDPQNEKTNTTRFPCVLASIIIMLSIILFATSDDEKRIGKEAAAAREAKLNDNPDESKKKKEIDAPTPEGIEFAVMSSSASNDIAKI